MISLLTIKCFAQAIFLLKYKSDPTASKISFWKIIWLENVSLNVINEILNLNSSLWHDGSTCDTILSFVHHVHAT